MTSILDKEFFKSSMWWDEAVALRDSDVVARAARLEESRQSIFRRIRSFEKPLVVRGEQVARDLSGANGAADKFTDALLDLVERAEAGEDWDPTEWQRLDSQVSGLIGSAEQLTARSLKVAEDLGDPLAALAAMEERMPSLRVRPFST